MNREDYRKWLQVEIERLHNCSAAYLETVPVNVVFKGKTVWPSQVEVFGLRGHPTATLAYAWGTAAVKYFGHLDESGDGFTRFVIVLELPPVNSAQKAVEVEIAESDKNLRELAKAVRKDIDEQFSKPFPSTN
jgi:hypothetical protein